MKNWKRIAAAAGAVVLLVVFCLPMLAALFGGADSRGLFMGALGAAFLVPLLAYMFLIAYRMFGRRQPETKEKNMENIIFDVGNVLVDFSWQEYLGSFGFSEEKYEKIADAVFRSEIWVERDQGLLSEEEYVQKFVDQAPEYEADIREVMRRTPECVHVRDYAQTWLGYLKKKGYRIYILSNYGHYMLERNKPQMTFLKHTDGEIFSCNVQQLKPNADIYETLLSRFGLKREKCVFIDDNKVNCEAAERIGIRAIHFESFQKTVDELKNLGVE